MSQRSDPVADSSRRAPAGAQMSSVVETPVSSSSPVRNAGVQPAVTSSAQRQAVANDPAVKRALELTEGTLVDVRPVSEADSGASA